MNLFRSIVAVFALVLLAVLNFIETTAGLPNTCSNCGKPAGKRWYAENVDQARSGLGLCADCAGEEQAADEGEEAADTSNATTTRGEAAQQVVSTAAAEVGKQLRAAEGQTPTAKPSGRK